MEEFIVSPKHFTTELEGLNLMILRHGKTPHNRPDHVATFAGARVNSELNEEGVDSTIKLGREIAENKQIDLIISSHMKRAVQTADIVAAQISELQRPVPNIIQIDDLQEIDVGDFTNLTEQEAKDLNATAADAFYDGRITDLDFPKGEDYTALKKRVERCIQNIANVAKNYHSVLIVGHGMFNRVLLHEIVPDHDELWKPRSYPHDRIISIQFKF